jgi:hypothetical protein
MQAMVVARVPAVALALLALGATVAGCGGSAAEPQGSAEPLAAAGADWAGMSDHDQREALRGCRLDAAFAAATSDGVQAPPFRASAYRAYANADGAQLRTALGAWLDVPEHARQTVGAACATVLRDLVASTPATTGPVADFSWPIAARSSDLYLAATGAAMTVPVRLTPAGARLAIGRAPGRAVSTARVTIAARGPIATVRLADIPLGVSYLQVRVQAGADATTRLLVVRRAAVTKPAAHASTFAPITLRGRDSRGLRVLDVPLRAVATVQTDRAALTLSSRGALLLAHAANGRETTVIPAGRYRDVAVAATGTWTVRIVPADT